MTRIIQICVIIRQICGLRYRAARASLVHMSAFIRGHLSPTHYSVCPLILDNLGALNLIHGCSQSRRSQSHFLLFAQLQPGLRYNRVESVSSGKRETSVFGPSSILSRTGLRLIPAGTPGGTFTLRQPVRAARIFHAPAGTVSRLICWLFSLPGTCVAPFRGRRWRRLGLRSRFPLSCRRFCCVLKRSWTPNESLRAAKFVSSTFRIAGGNLWGNVYLIRIPREFIHRPDIIRVRSLPFCFKDWPPAADQKPPGTHGAQALKLILTGQPSQGGRMGSVLRTSWLGCRSMLLFDRTARRERLDTSEKDKGVSRHRTSGTKGYCEM